MTHPRSLRHLLFLLLAVFGFSNYGSAQIAPEKDCSGAIEVCQMSYTFTQNLNGSGVDSAEVSPTLSCLGGGEINSIWMTTTFTQNGDFGFIITPAVSADDFDWAVFDISTNGCVGIIDGSSPELGCNFAGQAGLTGIDSNYNTSNFIPYVPVTTGQTVAIIISNWSGSSNGFTIDYSNSPVDPLSANCNANCAGNPIVVTPTVNHPLNTTGGTCDGNIALQVTGGTPPYTYMWDSIPSGDSLLNACPGQHYLTITGALGCTFDSVYVLYNAPLNMNNSSSQIASDTCSNACCGSIAVFPSGGTGGYLYSIDGATLQSSNQFDSLCCGTYTVTVYDSLTNSVTDSFTVGGNANPGISANTAICYGACVQLNAWGLSSYTWSNSSTLDDGTISNPIACPTAVTNYCVSGIDICGNASPMSCVEVSFIDSTISGTISGIQTIDLGDSTTLCFTTSSSGSLVWSTTASDSCIVVAPTASTTYYMQFTDDCGFVHYDSVLVNVVPVSVEQFSAGAGFDVVAYPNPSSSGSVTVDWKQLLPNATLRLYSVEGKLLQTSTVLNAHQTTLELPENGSVYFLEVSSEVGRKVVRLVRY